VGLVNEGVWVWGWRYDGVRGWRVVHIGLVLSSFFFLFLKFDFECGGRWDQGSRRFLFGGVSLCGGSPGVTIFSEG